MTAKEYLLRIRNMDAAVRCEDDELARLEAELASIRAADYSRERVQTSGYPEAAFIAAIDRILELQADRTRDMERLALARSEVIMRLEDMDNTAYSELLYLRYVGGETLESAAHIMRYSYDYVRHMHGEALKEFAKKYGKILEKQSIATRKYEEKAGWMSKTYKLKGETVEAFAVACEKTGVSQAGQLTKMMADFAEKINAENESQHTLAHSDLL